VFGHEKLPFTPLLIIPEQPSAAGARATRPGGIEANAAVMLKPGHGKPVEFRGKPLFFTMIAGV
jgi:hypothetical protein